jgi:LEA14-like dessication related protein
MIVGCLTAAGIFIFRKQLKARYLPIVEQIGEISIRVKDDTSYISSKLTVKNRSFLKIEIDTMKYKVSLFNKVYLQDIKCIGMVLTSNDIDTLDLAIKIPLKEILKDIKAERKLGDSASYSINIFLQYSTIFGKAEIPINRTAKIRIPQPPDIEVVELSSRRIRRKTIRAIAKIKITNYSVVDLTIKEMKYSMKILDHGDLKGKFGKAIKIKPKAATYVSIPIEINVKNIGKTFFQVLMNKDKYDYVLTLNGILESTDPFKESFLIDLTKNGKMELKK